MNKRVLIFANKFLSSIHPPINPSIYRVFTAKNSANGQAVRKC